VGICIFVFRHYRQLLAYTDESPAASTTTTVPTDPSPMLSMTGPLPTDLSMTGPPPLPILSMARMDLSMMMTAAPMLSMDSTPGGTTYTTTAADVPMPIVVVVVVEEADETTAHDVPTSSSTETPLYYQDRNNDTHDEAEMTPGPGPANKRRIQTGQDNSNINNNTISAGMKSLISVGGVVLAGWTVVVIYQQIQSVALLTSSCAMTTQSSIGDALALPAVV
jgi:hypothetical protein